MNYGVVNFIPFVDGNTGFLSPIKGTNPTTMTVDATHRGRVRAMARIRLNTRRVVPVWINLVDGKGIRRAGKRFKANGRQWLDLWIESDAGPDGVCSGISITFEDKRRRTVWIDSWAIESLR